jgi:pantoate--beta-alanine ligase
MNTVRTVAQLRTELAAARRAGAAVGFVPTMGALHDGHVSLLRRARLNCDVVVMSVFVNPTQFNDGADLAGYPRDERRDTRIAAAAGVDILFAPSGEEVYPPGFATRVSVAGLTDALEGAHRGAAHFDGVTTVVTKLLNMVAPDIAYFGQKDAQQALVVKRLVRDLDLPVRIEVCPTVRDADGLALSSRNARLSPDDRARAVALPRALAAAREVIAAGEHDAAAIAAAARAVLARDGVDPEYLELLSPDTLSPLRSLIGVGEALVAVAAQIGPVRLIDNTLIRVPAGTPGQHPQFNGSSAETIGALIANGGK